MGEFFKGWRRKVGLVTLVMTCVLAVGWMRSCVANDEITWRSETLASFLFSDDGVFGYEATTNEQVVNDIFSAFPTGWRSWPSSRLKPLEREARYDMFEELDVEWRWRWGDFDLGTVVHPVISFRHSIWQVPYWSLVLPLTLLSAWLILIKPRTTKRSP